MLSLTNAQLNMSGPIEHVGPCRCPTEHVGPSWTCGALLMPNWTCRAQLNIWGQAEQVGPADAQLNMSGLADAQLNMWGQLIPTWDFYS